MDNLAVFSGRIVFDHLPKTAGMAINRWLTGELGQACVSPNLVGAHTQLIRSYGGAYSIVSGHLHFDGEGLDPRYKYVTCVREPIDRALSWIFYVLKNFASTELSGLWQEVDALVQSDGRVVGDALRPHISNPYVEHFGRVFDAGFQTGESKIASSLAAIAKYEVIGFYDDIPTFLGELAALVEVPPPPRLEMVNVTNDRPAISSLSAEFLERLRELNSQDIAFCERLKGIREHRSLGRTVSSSLIEPKWAKYELPRNRSWAAPEFLLTSFNQSGSSFSRGQVVWFDLEFSIGESFLDLEVGIQLFDSAEQWAFGTNSQLLGTQMHCASLGRYRARYYLALDLPDGIYTVGFSFAAKTAGLPRQLAWHDRLSTFQVISPRSVPSVGYACVPTDFSIRKTDEEPVRLISDGKGYIVYDAIPSQVTRNQIFEINAVLHNQSREAWISVERFPITMSYHWENADGSIVVFDGLRSPIPISLLHAGGSTMVNVRILAPSLPNIYDLLILPVQEGSQWLDNCGFTPLKITLSVN